MASSKAENNPDKKEENDVKHEQPTVKYLTQTLQHLQKENEILKRDLLKSKRTPSNKIGFTLLLIGAGALGASILVSFTETSKAFAFIGLSLTFWGILFLFARPVKFVRGTLLDYTAISSYATIDRMLEDLQCQGRAIYVPPYPKEAYLPEYLKGLKEMIVFISASDFVAMPTIDEIARKQFLLRNPKGICIAPPGYGLVNLFEKELKMEFTRIDMDRLCDSLPTIIVNNLELAKEIEVSLENDLVHVTATDSVYKDLYSDENRFKSLHLIGCPLTSAIACALAKTSAKPVTIVKDLISPDLRNIEIWYQTVEVDKNAFSP